MFVLVVKTGRKNQRFEFKSHKNVVSEMHSVLCANLAENSQIKLGKKQYKKSSIYLSLNYEVSTPPTLDEFKMFYNDLIEGVRDSRSETKAFSDVEKTFKKTAFKYKTRGGTFELMSNLADKFGVEFRLIEAKKPKVPETKDHYIGMEFEILTNLDYNELNKLMAEKRMHKIVNVGTDGSIHGEGRKTAEVRLLTKQSEMVANVTKLMKILNSPEVEASVNSSCGFHVHIDCRNRKTKTVYNNLVKGLPLLTKLVPHDRISGKGREYCKINSEFELDKNKQDKYMAVNTQTIESKKTIEIRLHSGTTNATKIINWCTVLTSLVDSDLIKTDIKTVADFSNINNDTELHNYMQKRIDKFVKFGKKLSTAVDDALDFMEEVG